ncbi:phosphomannomutase [Microbacteriaceae bacterium SG_E_30_P1]|uniref:phosphomannomutase n=1 Tax=Antiquaquibacter oligotrophicus TaxID=2880260 RepID=A0ABT6KP82_9MICO|nr:HAD-IIB family hydrolase [Antiquaquibacter oligotrophicus]MDH6181669.1 phosphomannomutase [Antiquaquibacter oligotrophicus]UDF12647.1 HAD-IIB family hydrolase [Antiquaquibacter oligotrophicus]
MISSRSDIRAVVFDLDDTLAESKSTMHPDMSAALAALLERVEVCIISGGRFEQFQAQALNGFEASEDALSRLHLMPTCGTRYYRWDGGDWALQYAEDLTEDEKSRSIAALEEGARELGLWHPEPWGPIIEDRGSQITFSALGQQAPVAEKVAWDPDGAKKRALWEYVAPRLPDLEVRGGGSTSIDITRKGIDKAYGIAKLQEARGHSLDELLFIGDRLDETGNDYPVYALGVASVPVHGWQDTLVAVTALVDWLDSPSSELPVTTLPPLGQ